MANSNKVYLRGPILSLRNVSDGTPKVILRTCTTTRNELLFGRGLRLGISVNFWGDRDMIYAVCGEAILQFPFCLFPSFQSRPILNTHMKRCENYSIKLA